jgi:hypothetical protein
MEFWNGFFAGFLLAGICWCVQWFLRGIEPAPAPPPWTPPNPDTLTCPECYAENPPHARFCRRCGSSSGAVVVQKWMDVQRLPPERPAPPGTRLTRIDSRQIYDRVWEHTYHYSPKRSRNLDTWSPGDVLAVSDEDWRIHRRIFPGDC